MEVLKRLSIELLQASGQCVQCFQVFIQGILILEDTTDRLADFGSVQHRHTLFRPFGTQSPQGPSDFALRAWEIQRFLLHRMVWEREYHRGQAALVEILRKVAAIIKL